MTDGGPAAAVSLAWAGSAWALGWQDARDGNDEIYFARVDTDGVRIGSELRITNEAAPSLAPHVAWSGAEHAIAYQDDRSGLAAAYLARVDEAGTTVAQEILVWQGSGAPKLPAVSWGGSSGGYLLAWEDFRDTGYKIHTGAVAEDGTPPTADIRITDATGDAHHAAIAYGNLEHGIAWHDTRDGNAEIYFARTDPSGYKIGQEQRVSNADGDSIEPSLVFDGAGWALAWTDRRDGNDEIYFARLTQGGALLGPELRLTDDPAISTGASIGWNGGSYAVAWHDAREGTSAIYFLVLDAEGSPRGSAVRIAGGPGAAERPSLAWSGDGWAVGWQDDREVPTAIYVATCTP